MLSMRTNAHRALSPVDRTGTNPRPPYSASPFLRSLILSLLLVMLTTWALYALQSALNTGARGPLVRPFCIAYLIPLFVMTVRDGKRMGLITLVLAVAMSVYVLTPPVFSWHIHRLRDWAELGLLLLTGGVVVLGLDEFRRALATRENVEDTPFTTGLLEHAKQAAQGVPGVAVLGPCLLRRQGMQYVMGVDVFADPHLTLQQSEVVGKQVEAAIRQTNGLIYDVRVRMRPQGQEQEIAHPGH